MESRVSFFRSSALLVLSALAPPASAQDGAYDPGFANGGRDWIDVSSSTSELGGKMLRLPNGNFFMAGSCNFIACAAWLTPSGSLASGYGTSGTGTAWFSAFPGWLAPGDDGGADDAAAFLDGRVVLTDSYNSAGHVAVLRADGTGLDAAVGNGAGYIAPPFYAQLVRVTPQQDVIVVGQNRGTPNAIVVARYDSTLHLDTSFGSAGSTTIGFPGEDTFPAGMTLQKDGKIVVVASVTSSPPAIGIVRLTAGGSPDQDFGINSDGRFKGAFGNTYGVAAADITVDKQGRLVFVGEVHTNSGNNGKWFVNRLLSGGATDAGFNGGQPQQFAIFDTSQGYSPRAETVAVQNDGRIVAVGTMDRSTLIDKYFAVARFTDSGAFDPSYGIAGQSYGDMSPQPDPTGDQPKSMVIVPGGIVIGGFTTVTGGESRFSATKVRIDPLFASDFE